MTAQRLLDVLMRLCDPVVQTGRALSVLTTDGLCCAVLCCQADVSGEVVDFIADNGKPVTVGQVGCLPANSFTPIVPLPLLQRSGEPHKLARSRTHLAAADVLLSSSPSDG